MLLENPIISLILWLLSSLLEVFRMFFILKISRNDPFYVKREVYISTYIVNAIVTIVAFFIGISFVTTGTIELLIIVASFFLAINDSFSNRIWTILTITLFEMTFNSTSLAILRFFWN